MTPRPGRTLFWAVGCLCTAWLVGVVCAVHVSTWQAPPALMVFGADHVWRGATAGFRAVARDSGARLPLPGTRIEAWLQDARIEGPHVTAPAGDTAAWTLAVPAFAGNAASLVVRMHPEHGISVPDIVLPLEVVDKPANAALSLTPPNFHAPTVAIHAPGVEITLVPLGGQFAVGLQNPGIGRVLRDGRPWRNVRVRSPGLHLDTRTDDAGLFEFVYTPPLHPEPLRFVPGEDDAPMWVDLVPRVAVSQFQMLVPTRCFARAEPGPLHIDALPLREPLAVDLWLDDLLLGTTALPVRERSLDITLGIKAALPAGFLTVAVFRHVLTPGAPAVATRPMGTSADAPLAALMQRGARDAWLEALRAPGSERAAAFALARVQPAHRATPLMHDSTAAVFEAFEKRRLAVRGRIYQVMGGLMGLSLAAIALALWHMRRTLHRAVGDVLADAEDLQAPDAEAARAVTRVAHRLWLVLAVSALALACYGLLEVVTRLRWS